MSAVDQHTPYLAVYRAIEETAFARNVPPGCRGEVYGAIDRLIALGAPADHVALAGTVSVALHRLWQARRGGGRAIAEAEADLDQAGIAWLQTPMHLGAC